MGDDGRAKIEEMEATEIPGRSGGSYCSLLGLRICHIMIHGRTERSLKMTGFVSLSVRKSLKHFLGPKLTTEGLSGSTYNDRHPAWMSNFESYKFRTFQEHENVNFVCN